MLQTIYAQCRCCCSSLLVLHPRTKFFSYRFHAHQFYVKLIYLPSFFHLTVSDATIDFCRWSEKEFRGDIWSSQRFWIIYKRKTTSCCCRTTKEWWLPAVENKTSCESSQTNHSNIRTTRSTKTSLTQGLCRFATFISNRFNSNFTLWYLKVLRLMGPFAYFIHSLKNWQ